MEKFKFYGGLLFLLCLASCEVEEAPLDLSDTYDASIEAERNYNNGIINSYSSEVVLQWNELLSRSIDNRMPQPAEVKIYAMVTLAMHDALNNVIPKYETYALDNSGVNAEGISKKNIHSIADAAVSQAARDVLIAVFPAATVNANNLLNTILSGIQETSLKDQGINIGKNAATALFQKRQNDFPLAFYSYSGSTEPGMYQANFMPWMLANPPIWPANAVYAPNLGSLTPFGILSGDQFRDEAPYPLNTQSYITDYNEVKSLGCTVCPLRTPEQTEIGAFWVENTSSSMNRMARNLIVQRKLDGWEAARLIGLIQMSQMDAYIASFEGKYYFNFWRPITAIRGGDFDGVDATIGDVSWIPAFTTPPTPEFPSTHAYNGGAAAEVFKGFFKSDHINLKVTSPYYVPGVERHLSSFSQMSYENAVSRIYIGYHFRRAIEIGEMQGRELGKYVFENNLREIKKVI